MTYRQVSEIPVDMLQLAVAFQALSAISITWFYNFFFSKHKLMFPPEHYLEEFLEA